MFSKENIINTVERLSSLTDMTADTFIVSGDAALVMNNKKSFSENLGIEVLPHRFNKLEYILPNYKNRYQSSPRRDGRIEIVNELKIGVEHGDINITAFLIPELEVHQYLGVYFRTLPSIIDLKRFLCTVKDQRDLISLGYML